MVEFDVAMVAIVVTEELDTIKAYQWVARVGKVRDSEDCDCQ